MSTLEQVRAKIRANMPKEIPPLTWEPINKYALRSTCKRFTVCKGQVNGVTQYEVWMGQTPLGFRLKSADEAKAIAAQHALVLK